LNNTAIYGIGVYGKLFLDCLDKVDFIIDDYYPKDTYKKIPIVNLNSIPKKTIIYISVLQYSKQIEQKLVAKGFDNIINFTDSILTIPNILFKIQKLNHLWFVEDTNLMINDDKLSKVKSLLVDKKSKNILNEIINFRKTLNTKYYTKPSDIEYFPKDVPILDNIKDINFIDCGAYTGDTIEALVKQKISINSTISFEPDFDNLEKLNKTLGCLSTKDSNFIVYPLGVYSKNDILRFANNGINSSARLDNKSDVMISVVALDSVILNANPNFIKMDVEGAEKEALIGAKKTIQKYKPNLAICLYHKPEDLWDLPLLIDEISNNGYDMYIRVHEDLYLSTVLYCIGKI
jgi:FkbM family methyltransferase